MKREIILASGSPRRKELLQKLGLRFRVMPSQYDEQLDDARTPEAVAIELGLGKVMEIAERFPEAIVIGGDTIVTIDGKQLGKAADIDEALAMWRLLAGRPHTVTTSVVVVCLAEQYESAVADNTSVYMKPYDQAVIMTYLEQGTYVDKAGAYAIQDIPDLVERIEGDRETVLGLPTRLLTDPLQQLAYLHEVK